MLATLPRKKKSIVAVVPTCLFTLFVSRAINTPSIWHKPLEPSLVALLPHWVVGRDEKRIEIKRKPPNQQLLT